MPSWSYLSELCSQGFILWQVTDPLSHFLPLCLSAQCQQIWNKQMYKWTDEEQNLMFPTNVSHHKRVLKNGIGFHSAVYAQQQPGIKKQYVKQANVQTEVWLLPLIPLSVTMHYIFPHHHHHHRIISLTGTGKYRCVISILPCQTPDINKHSYYFPLAIKKSVAVVPAEKCSFQLLKSCILKFIQSKSVGVTDRSPDN